MPPILPFLLFPIDFNEASLLQFYKYKKVNVLPPPSREPGEVPSLRESPAEDVANYSAFSHLMGSGRHRTQTQPNHTWAPGLQEGEIKHGAFKFPVLSLCFYPLYIQTS